MGKSDRGGRRSEFRVSISGLPSSCSWQDLKDHMRKAGEVVYTDVNRKGDGIVEYKTAEGMENALRTLDESNFENFRDRAVIRVKAAVSEGDDRGDRRSEESRSRRQESRGRRSRSRSRSRSASRSRSPSERSKRSRSRSRSS